MTPSRIALFLPLYLAAAAQAQFTTYQGNAAVQTTWRNNVLSTFGRPAPMEQFEGYHATIAGGVSDQIRTLPALGVVFDGDLPNGYPGVYTNSSEAHSGTNQLANFGGGLGQFHDYFIRPAPGKSIRALGVWQCDPQGNVVLDCYDALDQPVGSITALINNGSGNNFGAFISTIPIMKIKVEGVEGDGWNHIDDLQIIVSPAPCRADMGKQGGIAGQDGLLDNNDFVVFINYFFTLFPVADVGIQGGITGHDGLFDNNDFVVFISDFFSGCPA